MLRFILALLLAATLTAPARAAETKADGLTVHYEVTGSGPTVLFVHGWTCDETSWAAQVPAFTGKYRVVTLDLPGHGRSQSPARQQDFSMVLFAKAVEAVRQAVGADRIVLVGHSMGAVVIRQYAFDYPQHVAGLVAVDGPLDVRTFAASVGGTPPMDLESRKALVESMFVPGTTEPLRAQIRKTMFGTPEKTALGAGAAMFDPVIQSDRKIAFPALSVYAGSSVFAGDTKTGEMLTDWRSVQVPGTGHFLMMERPAEFNRLLADFLETRARY